MSDNSVNILVSTCTLRYGQVSQRSLISQAFVVKTPEGSIPLILYLSTSDCGEFIKAYVQCQNVEGYKVLTSLTFDLSYVFDHEDNTGIHWNSSMNKTCPGTKWFNLCCYQDHKNIWITCEVYYKLDENNPYSERMVEMYN